MDGRQILFGIDLGVRVCVYGCGGCVCVCVYVYGCGGCVCRYTKLIMVRTSSPVRQATTTAIVKHERIDGGWRGAKGLKWCADAIYFIYIYCLGPALLKKGFRHQGLKNSRTPRETDH